MGRSRYLDHPEPGFFDLNVHAKPGTAQVRMGPGFASLTSALGMLVLLGPGPHFEQRGSKWMWSTRQAVTVTVLTHHDPSV